jgi:hypothetical protein
MIVFNMIATNICKKLMNSALLRSAESVRIYLSTEVSAQGNKSTQNLQNTGMYILKYGSRCHPTAICIDEI